MIKKTERRKITVLNLSGVLPPRLASYFETKGALVVQGDSTDLNHNWTHILTKDLQDFSQLEVTHKTIEKDIKVISLSPVHHPKSFSSANGRLIFEPLWLRSELGQFILDKFFQEFEGITGKEKVPSFKEIGNFNIINPFSTGEYLDRMVFHAFESGTRGLAVKSYFDHLIMFLAGLKAKSKMGWPIEASYGHYQGIFGVQLQFFSNSLLLKEVTSSLSDMKSRKTEEYLLNLGIQSTDFFDFTYLTDVKKVVITALWSNEAWVTFENRGMMFNELSSKAAFAKYPMDGNATAASEVEISDQSIKVDLPAVAVDPEVTVVKGVTNKEVEAVQNIKGSRPDKEGSETVSGNFDEKEGSQVVKGQKDQKDNFKVSIGGLPEDEQGIMIIKGAPGAKKGSMQVRESKGEGADLEDDMIIVKGGEGAKMKSSMSLKTNSEDSAEDEKNDLFIVKGEKKKKQAPTQFNHGKSVEELEESDVIIIKGGDGSETRPKSMFDNMQLKILNNMPEEDQTAFVKHIEQQKVESQASENKQKQLEMQVKTLISENTLLKTKLRKLITEVKINKEAKSKMAEINRRVSAKGITDESKRILIESAQKENFFLQEIERSQRQIKSKEAILEKTREMNANALARKEKDIQDLQQKIDELNEILSSNHPQMLMNQIKILERENENQLKMVEMYKSKISVLTSNLEKQQTKEDGESIKDEARKLSLINIQLKNQLDSASKELNKYQEKAAHDTAMIASLKAEKLKNDQLLKKAQFDSRKTSEVGVSKVQHDIEIKKLNLELTRMEHVMREAQKKSAELESKLQDAQKSTKSSVAVGGLDEASKGKVLQLETSLKKLTQDLVENRNQLAEMKKETNKLRQDKTALQNQVDRLKKDLVKANNKVPKNPKDGQNAA